MGKVNNLVKSIQKDLRVLASQEKAEFLPRFFKTGKGEYGEGDIFIGVTVPCIRKTAIRYAKDLSFGDIKVLITSAIHEERYVAVEVLVHLYEQSNLMEKKQIFDFYVKNKEWVNNWDLVDTSAPYIVGDYLLQKKSIAVLKKLARSKSLWDRRIAIVSTFAFIKNCRDKECYEIADMLLLDSHDLIHKAVGWMLRETGKWVSKKSLEGYLKTRYKKMPRTMLRYATEHFPKIERQKYLLAKK